MLGPLETKLIGLLLIVLMFGMGATLTGESFRTVAKSPKAFLIGTASQFGWMPLLAFLLAKGLSLPAPAAIGLIVMGACPGGTTSNLFAHLARADVALSISMTAASKVLGIVMMPLCLYVYARPFLGAEIAIPYGEIVKALALLLVPVGLAMALRRRFGERFAVVAEKVGSIAGIVVLVAVVGLMVVRNAGIFFTVTPAMYLASMLLSGLAMTLGYLAARLGGLSIPQRRTVALETGIQNSALCFAVIVLSFPGDAQVEFLKVPLLSALFLLLEGTAITLYWRASDARKAADAAAVAPAA